jgi:hypothetical protein
MLMQQKPPHACIHERLCSDTAFDGGPQDAGQISSAVQLCHAQILYDRICAGLCLLKSDVSKTHNTALLTVTVVASGSASCMPVWRSKPICRLSRSGFSRSLLFQTWSFLCHHQQRRAMQCVHACLWRHVTCLCRRRPDALAVDFDDRHGHAEVIPCSAQLLQC